MADNTVLNAGTGGDTISTDDVGGGVKAQRVKVQFGDDGVATDVNSTTPLPVTIGGATATVPVDASGSTVPVVNTTPANMQVRAEGREAHDAAQTGFPVRIAGKYSSSIAKVSASGDVVNFALTQDGKILTMHEAPAADTTNVNTNYSSAQTNATLIATPGANKRLVIVEVVFSHDTIGTVLLNEDPAGSPATKWGPHYHLASTPALVVTNTYIPLTANKALGITTTGAGNATITLRAIVENV